VPCEGTNQLDDGNIPDSALPHRLYQNSRTRKAITAMTDRTTMGSKTAITTASQSFILSVVDFRISRFRCF